MADVKAERRLNGRPDSNSSFAKSRWFTRSWTLQELIAPTAVYFFATDWSKIGSKQELQDELEWYTLVPKLALLGGDLEEFNVAQKMSWVSQRKATRIEDRA